MPPVNVSIDFSALADLITNAIFTGLQHLVSPLPGDFENWLWHSVVGILTAQGPMNLLTHIPLQWTAQNPDVKLLWQNLLPIQAGLGAVVMMIGGYRVVHGTEEFWTVVVKYGLLVAAGLGMGFFGLLVLNLVNGLSDAIGTAPMDIRSEVMPNDLVLGAMLIIGAVFAVLAWIKGAVGIVFIDVLFVTAPFVFPLSALPFMGGLGKWWIEEATTWCLRPIMVAIVLRLALGIGLVNAGGMQFLFAVVGFWMAYKMDTFLRRFSVGAWGSVANFGLVSRGASMAAAAFGGGPVAARAAAAASATP